jgi:dTDP-glucose 4,6-dehydratase
MNILVTGGAGFIGSNYVRRIIDGTLKGISNIKVVDKLTYAGNLNNFSKVERDKFEFIQADICDRQSLERILIGIDSVINFAAESHVDRSIENSYPFIEANVVGTSTLLDLSLKSGVNNFVQVSTDEVYGSIDDGSWQEDDPVLPNSPYSASKASADLFCRSFHKTHNLNVKITRSSNNYGPFQFPEKIIPLFITNLLAGEKLPVYGNGQNKRDWLHVDDHCEGIHKVLQNGLAGEIYNIGGGTELSNLDLTIELLNLFGLKKDFIDFVPDRKGHDYRYSVDYSKIQNKLNYYPRIKFRDGIDSTIEWYKQNSGWWKPLIRRK